MTADYKVYANAFFELAVEEGCLDTVYEELKAVDNILKENPDYIKIVSSTLLSAKQKKQLWASAFSTLSELSGNFLGLLISKNMFSFFSKCADAFYKLYYKEKGILTVEAISAVELSEEEKSRLICKIEKSEGKKVLLSCAVDSTLIGGMVLRFDGKEIDSSLKTKLSGIQTKLIEI